MPTPSDINNGLYNAMVQGLGLSRQTFQIIQPQPPLLANNDRFLWNYFNNIPPLSLTQNIIQSGGNQFFSNYNALFSALTSVVANRFQQDVGDVIFNEFLDFIARRPEPASIDQLSTIFRMWAFLRHPQVANIGASDLAAAALDPIASGQLALLEYLGDPGRDPPRPARQPDWDLGYNELISLLSQSPQSSPPSGFNFRQSTMNTNVSNTWSGGSHSGFFGLWGGSSSNSRQTVIFADNEFTVNASFGHVLLFAPVPGPWYSSAALGLAFSNPTGAPWNPDVPINWNDFFDPTSGNMLRFMVNLIVVDTMRIDVRSFARFSLDDQVIIQNNSGGGLWPFYVGNSSSGANQQVSFADDGTMTVTTSSLPGVPIVLGGDVLPVAQYLGEAPLQPLMP